MSRLRVAVLFGGRSAEHEVSCLSARSVIDALDLDEVEVIPIGISREGRWHRLPGPPALPSETGRMPEVIPGAGTAVELAGEAASSELVSADGSREPVDVVFPVLHGPAGEDGAVQGLLELAGVPYVGSGVLGSALGLHKDVQKRLLRDAGIPIGPYEPVHEREWLDDPAPAEAAARALGYPVFVKPATLGSSVGVTRVDEEAGLAPALREAFRYAREALVERAAQGARELECSVLGNDEPVASVPGEIVTEGHAFYDYEAKYLDEHGARLLIPADVPPEVRTEVQRLAIASFRAIRCAGMARVDFFLLDDGQLWVNEVNTIPGFTSISMYPKLWEASGLPYPELVRRLLDLAIERRGAERKSTGVPELGGGD
ncbi:MAG TPA: D-alanine--D-alanine ligase family protein [Actinomycetota bacterium]|nr:D-alanine--D-alanine ligase family protein [Actinomycetota bacterium]